MKTVSTLTLLAAGCALPAHASTVLIDFGATTAATVSDAGTFWNTVTLPVTSDLLDTAGNPTALDINFTTPYAANNPGGLTTPSALLLGDFAVASATADYFFTTSSASFNIEGLNPALTYDIRLFGTRNTSGVRETRYSLSGAAAASQVLQTSGPGAGDAGAEGNDNTIILFSSVAPDALGNIGVTYAVESGGFGYLGVMGITANATPIPTPNALALGIAGLGLAAIRRR